MFKLQKVRILRKIKVLEQCLPEPTPKERFFMTRLFHFVRNAALLAGVFAACAANVNAQSVLYFSDESLNASGNITPKALAAEGITPMVATNEADFVSQLNAGGWDLAILLEQVDELPDARTALVSWIGGGNRALAATSYMTDSFAAAFNASFVGNLAVDAATVSSNGNPIWNGVVSPITLTNPGYGTFSVELAAGTGGVVAGTFETGTAAIVIGNNGKTQLNGFLDDTYDQVTESKRITLASRQIRATLNAGAVVPEPGTVGLMLLGGVAALRRRRGGNVKHTA